MATVKIDSFHSIVPRQHQTQLSDGMAVDAHNVRLKNGKLVPLKEPNTVQDVSVRYENGLSKIEDAQSVYCWKHTRNDGTTWIEFVVFPGIVWFAESNVADDDYDRLFVSGDTGVSYVDDGNVTHSNTPACFYYHKNLNTVVRQSLCKGVLPKLNVSRASGSSPLDDDKKRYAYFFATWVDAYGYESGCSDPSNAKNSGSTYESDTLEYNDGDTVSVAAIVIPAGWRSKVSKVRIYKTIAGTSEDGDYIAFVAELNRDAVESAFSFRVADEDVGEVMPQFESPTPGLRDIVKVPGSFYCGFDSRYPKSVMFSDVNHPSNWPIAYRYDVNDNIVALASTSSMVFALTDGWPYVMSGTAPEAMTVSKLAGPAACVSPRGVCVYRNAVYYVSNQGLMTVYNDADAGTVCQNMTDKIFTKQQWLDLNPSSCVIGQFDGALFLFFSLSDGTHKGLCIDLTESLNAVTTHDEVATCVCTDDRTDKMYYVREVV